MKELEKPVGKSQLFKDLVTLESKLNKQFKTEHSLVRLGEKVGIKLPSISLNLPTFDNYVIGTGGIPRGRIIEFFGPESSGKTTIALHTIACEQKENPDKLCGFVDAEHALDPTYASTLGVNVDELVISQPDCGEEALTIVEEMIESGLFSLIVVDSVSALVPRAELEGAMGDANIGLQARLMSQAMRKLTGPCAKNNVTVVFINQIREKIGVMFGSPETTSGGRALKFFASVRIDVRRKEAITEENTLVGHQIKLKAVKNKVGVPFRETIVNLYYHKGFDTNADLIEQAIKEGIIEQSGAWYKYDGDNYRRTELNEESIVNEIKGKINV